MTDTPGTQSVVIERTLDAPVDLVWQMWTEAEHFAAWYGPMGASIPTANMDVSPGGRRLICMEMAGPDGTMQMWFAGEYVEIDPTTRLVYTEAMADADGNVLPPEAMGMPAGAPPPSLSSLISETRASVVSIRPEMEEAFCRAVLVTLAGSMTPALIMSS